MKNRKLQLFRLRKLVGYNHQYLPLLSLSFSAAMLFLCGRAIANNAVLRSMFSCQAQGLSGIIPTIDISYQQGTNLSFIPAGETIKKVWLNDPSEVTMDFDGPMCMQLGQENNGDCQNSAANVIQLRRIQRLNIPGIPKTSNTLLTVITEAQGQKKLYTFRILYQNTAPKYHTLAIYPDQSANGANCARQ